MSKSKDVECPYCGEWQEVNHDDGAGYEEGKKHEQQCGDCEKYFTFETTICYHYEAEQADCLNGDPHQLEPVIHFPRHWPNWVRCKNCEHEERGQYIQEVE
jgi:hypothetical protein